VTAPLPDLGTLCRYGAILPREPEALPDLSRAIEVVRGSRREASPEERQAAFEGALEAAVDAACREAIARDGRAPVVSLSGGLDSSAVASFARAHGAATVTLAVGRAAEEGAHAAATLGVAHEAIAPPAEGPLATPLEDVVRALGAPTHSAAPFAFLGLWRSLAARGARAVITGDGADELLAGHAYHAARRLAWAGADVSNDEALFASYRRVRGLEAEIDLGALLTPEARHRLAREHPPWETSAAARALGALVRGVAAPAERLRLLDVVLRMRAQCVDLQARLCAAAGLGYGAPFAAPDVVLAAMAIPLAPERPAKGPLRALLERRTAPERRAGAPWGGLEKEPIHAPTGGRPREALPTAWRLALTPEATGRAGLFRPEAIAARLAEVAPDRPFLPRALVVAATSHFYLDR